MATTPFSQSFSAESYFATQPPPSTLSHDIAGVRDFVQRQILVGKRVVLVTSGGTTVPLELNVVRFLDNFSAGLVLDNDTLQIPGTRGATSAEYFLKAGYAVIFMHRQFSLQPFSRHYSHSTNPFLDFLEIDKPSFSESPSLISVTPDKRADMLEVLMAYKSVQASGTLHTLTFITVNDYLWLLRSVSQELSILRRGAMYYLAAAVSDFFLPRQKMSEHKIQSGKGSLHIEMDQVPKILKSMVDEWTRDGYIVSFKLETDETLLIPKARAALERYGHQVVIGNTLHNRKYQVVFVSRRSPSPSPISSPYVPDGQHITVDTSNSMVHAPSAPDGEFMESWLHITIPVSSPGTGHAKEIEEDIIQELVKRHDAWIGISTEE